MGLVEKNAREMYADDVRLAIDSGFDCSFYRRVDGHVDQLGFDELPEDVRAMYITAATSPVVDCTERGRRERMGIQA